MWDPYNGTFRRARKGSFVESVAVPEVDPDAWPTVCAEISAAWVPYVLGALGQLAQPSTWDTTDPAVRALVLARAVDLIMLVGNAEVCMQAGTRAMTIGAGAASGTAAVTFPDPFASAPVVVVSESSGLYIASAASVTASGFTAKVTADGPLLAGGSATLSWIARVP